jgi:hypothetical protein
MKPAQQINPEDGDIISRLRDGVKDRPIAEQLLEMKREFRSVTRGLDTRIRQLETENRVLLNLVTSLETGVRTQGERRSAMLDYVTDAGKGADDA